MLKNLLMEAAGKWEEWDVGWWGDLAWELRKKKKKDQNGMWQSLKPLTWRRKLREKWDVQEKGERNRREHRADERQHIREYSSSL